MNRVEQCLIRGNQQNIDPINEKEEEKHMATRICPFFSSLHSWVGKLNLDFPNFEAEKGPSTETTCQSVYLARTCD